MMSKWDHEPKKRVGTKLELNVPFKSERDGKRKRERQLSEGRA